MAYVAYTVEAPQRAIDALDPLLYPGLVTLGDIRQQCLEMFLEFEGTPGGDSSALYDNLIIRAADKVCRATDCLYGVESQDLTANQYTYCSPNIYRIIQMRVLDSGGIWRPLSPVSVKDMGRVASTNWLNDPANDPPQYAVMGAPSSASGSVRLYPTPSTSRTAAIHFEGFMTTGRVWSYNTDGTAKTMSDDTPFPGPQWAVDAVVYQTLILRCIQYPTKENAARMPMLQAEYRSAIGEIEQKAANWYTHDRINRWRSLWR
jgi:hypothetical protein